MKYTGNIYLFKNRASEQNVMNRSVQKVKSPSLYLYSVQYSTSTVPLLSLDRPIGTEYTHNTEFYVEIFVSCTKKPKDLTLL